MDEFSKPVNLDLELGTSKMTDRHYDAGPEQTSASTYTSDEIPTYKFILTKEEEEEEERRKHIQDIRIRRI